MCMLDTIRAKSGEIREIAKRHKAEKIWVFGSCARKEERPDSDVDLLVKFASNIGMLSEIQMQNEMKAFFGRNVDLVPVSALRKSPWLAVNVCREAVLVLQNDISALRDRLRPIYEALPADPELPDNLFEFEEA